MSEVASEQDLRNTHLSDEALHRRLTAVWSTPPGVWGALITVDHKVIGRRYIATAFLFLFLGGTCSGCHAPSARPSGKQSDWARYI